MALEALAVSQPRKDSSVENVGSADDVAAVSNNAVVVVSAAGGCKGAAAVKKCMQ